jgi:hypothetical protein
MKDDEDSGISGVGIMEYVPFAVSNTARGRREGIAVADTRTGKYT